MPAMDKPMLIAGRIIAGLGIAFISLFALDVFGSGSAIDVAIGLVMHLMPSFVLLAILALSWRWPMVSGLAFLAISIAGFVLLSNLAWVNALLAGPFFLAGLLLVLGAYRALTRPPAPGSR